MKVPWQDYYLKKPPPYVDLDLQLQNGDFVKGHYNAILDCFWVQMDDDWVRLPKDRIARWKVILQ